MMMLARSRARARATAAGQLQQQQAGSRGKQAALYHFSCHAAQRIASHRTKPFSSQWAAALSRTIYQQRFSC